ncbi:serine/threonine-protein kinase [Anaerovibrio sp. RM50]|uniref:serine/threonine protein kinase n=1 Tax=Anaerovibrio sp. RM50 TaxID=1200557 RepID=UPI00068785AD|nr:serine/threonine-protein kinase [Anaerovibrio sp. RM50]
MGQDNSRTAMELAEEYIKSKYEKVRLLHESDRAEVWLAADSTGSFVVIKYIKLANLPYSTLKTMGKSLWPEVIYCTEDEHNTIVVEEFINGESFEELLANRKHLTEARARELLLQLCDGLGMLHNKGIIHRDIKPSNLILQNVGGHDFARLIDYDAARTVKEEQKEDTRLLGTKGYAPPEQYGYGQTDQRSDIYSLGITFQEMMGPDYKGWLKAILQKCTEVDARSRYQTVKDLKNALLYHRRNKLLKVAGIAAVSLAVVLVIWTNWQHSHDEKIIPPAVEEIMEEVKEKVPLPSVEEKTPEAEKDKPESKESGSVQQENGPIPHENKPNTMENNKAVQEAATGAETGKNAVYAKYYFNGERQGAWTDRFETPRNDWGTFFTIPPNIWKNWSDTYPNDWEVRVTVDNRSNKHWENPHLSVWTTDGVGGESKDYYGNTLAPGESCVFVVPLNEFRLPVLHKERRRQEMHFQLYASGDQMLFGEKAEMDFELEK